jgi:hypothetical protein
MIQRIQTLYLLIAAVLVAMLFFFPFAEIAGSDGTIYAFDAKGIYNQGVPNAEKIYGSLPINLLSGFTLGLLLIIIFQFKNRVRQMRLSTLSIFILVGLSGIIFYYTWKSASIIGGTYSLSLVTAFPLISAILVYLAIRSIARDELLVRSIDRIR